MIGMNHLITTDAVRSLKIMRFESPQIPGPKGFRNQVSGLISEASKPCEAILRISSRIHKRTFDLTRYTSVRSVIVVNH